MVFEKNINANNEGYMNLEKPVIGVVVIVVVVSTCCCCLCCFLLTRHNNIDFHLVVNSVFFGISLNSCLGSS